MITKETGSGKDKTINLPRFITFEHPYFGRLRFESRYDITCGRLFLLPVFTSYEKIEVDMDVLRMNGEFSDNLLRQILKLHTGKMSMRLRSEMISIIESAHPLFLDGDPKDVSK